MSSLSLLDAIFKEEGFGASPNNLPTRNNNPGNIVYGSFAASYGATKDPSSNFAVFPSVSVGEQAASDLLGSSSYAGLSISDAISKWNGYGSNSSSYIQNIVNWTGYDPSTLVGDALSGNTVNYISDPSINNDPNFDVSNNYDFSNVLDSSTIGVDTPTGLLIASGVGLGMILLFKLFSR